MSGISGLVGEPLRAPGCDGFLRSTDLRATGHTLGLELDRVVLGVSAPTARHLSKCTKEGDGYVACIAGHIVVRPELDWETLLQQLRDGRADLLARLSGRFAIALFDRMQRTLYLITDRLGQYPLYWSKHEKRVAFSTAQSSFCALPEHGEFEAAWFQELFLLNFSAQHRSFLKNVQRVPAATVMKIDLVDATCTLRVYAPRFKPSTQSAPLSSELDRAISVFEHRFPLYVESGERAVCGISSGFDSRTILALFGSLPGFAAFTYGIPESADIDSGKKIAAHMGIDHRTVLFDAAFEQALPQLMWDTVWLSSGLQGAIRATLPYAYRGMTEQLAPVDVTLSGASGDQLFRGHGNVPSIVSPAVDALFRTGSLPPNLSDQCDRMFNAPADAVTLMHGFQAQQRAQYGDPQAAAAHLGYLTYEAPPEYFAGEASIVDQYSDFRTPFCDIEVVELAYSISLSTLGFSKFVHGKPDALAKNRLQANLIKRHAQLAQLSIQDKPLSVYASGSQARYQFARVAGWLRRRAGAPAPSALLERWNHWFGTVLHGEFASLLAPGAAIERFIRRPFIDDALRARDVYWLNKLATAEIVMSLAARGWARRA